MLTQLCCILRGGLQGNTEKVKGYAELIVKQYYDEKVSYMNATEEQKIAKCFKDILENKPSTVTLDDSNKNKLHCIPECIAEQCVLCCTVCGKIVITGRDVKTKLTINGFEKDEKSVGENF